MKKNRRLPVMAYMGVLCLALTGCNSASKNSDTVEAKNIEEVTKDSSTTALSNSEKAKAVATAVKYKEAESNHVDCYITCNGTTAECEGVGAEYSNGVLRITKAGCYQITGELDDGRIEVNVGKEDEVEIILNGVEVTCSDYAPFVVWQADKTFIQLADGTINQFTDGGNYYVSNSTESAIEDGLDSNTDQNTEEAPSAAFFSKDDIGFSGNGTLLVTANCNDGITSKDDIWFTGGTYQITAKDDGIIGKDSIAVKAGSFQIEAGGDGMKSTKEEDEQKGFVAVQEGTFDIIAGNDGIQASTYIWLEGGTYHITAGGGSENAEQHMDNINRRGNIAETQTEDSESYKGIKAGVDIFIQDGSFQLDCADDTIHSNDTLTIQGGDFVMESGDDGIHSDSVVMIAGGTITIEKSYEGIEAESILIQDGTIKVTASDDGLNAANGDSVEGMDGPGGRPQNPGGNEQMGSEQQNDSNSCLLAIEGGELYVNAGGDGLDSNGSIAMSGGNVYVDGPTNSGNGILDYENEMVMVGGNLVGAGSSGMLQSISESSTQPGLAVVFDASQKAGTKVVIKDSAEEEILSYTPAKEFSALIVSTDKLELGETYDIYLGNEKYTSLELSSISTSNGNIGMGRGQGGRGGMKGHGEGGTMTPPDGNGMERPEDEGMLPPDEDQMPSRDEKGQGRPDWNPGEDNKNSIPNFDKEDIEEDSSI